MFSAIFWKDVGERAGKTFAQTLMSTLTPAGIGLATGGLKTAIAGAALAALYSVLTSVASVKVPGGDGVTASLVRAIRHGRHEAAHPPIPEV